MWSNPKGEEGPISPKKALLYMKQSGPFKSAYEKAKAEKFKRPKGVYEFEEEGINPFQRDNFLT